MTGHHDFCRKNVRSSSHKHLFTGFFPVSGKLPTEGFKDLKHVGKKFIPLTRNVNEYAFSLSWALTIYEKTVVKEFWPFGNIS